MAGKTINLIILTGLFIISFIIGLIIFRIEKSEIYPYYANQYTPNNNKSIAIIGDSWAYRAPQFIKEKYNDYNFFISGQPGAKTKRIYQNLFSEKDPWGTKKILDERPQYCIIFGGINDIHGQYGPEYYSFHMVQIIKTLINNGTKPIVIELPYFYNKEQYRVYPFYKKFAYFILRIITSKSFKTDLIQLYRDSFKQKIINENLISSIIYVQTDDLLKGRKELYDDNLHLNNEGYSLLFDKIMNFIY